MGSWIVGAEPDGKPRRSGKDIAGVAHLQAWATAPRASTVSPARYTEALRNTYLGPWYWYMYQSNTKGTGTHDVSVRCLRRRTAIPHTVCCHVPAELAAHVACQHTDRANRYLCHHAGRQCRCPLRARPRATRPHDHPPPASEATPGPPPLCHPHPPRRGPSRPRCPAAAGD